MKKTKPLLELGAIVHTPGAEKAIKESGQHESDFILRHICGDWGDVCKEDSKLNDESIEAEERILSEYKTKKGVRIWVITEADRSVTTLLLPEEY